MLQMKMSGLLWEDSKSLERKGGESGEGFRCLTFCLYTDILKYVQIYVCSKIHQSYLEGKPVYHYWLCKLRTQTGCEAEMTP